MVQLYLSRPRALPTSELYADDGNRYSHENDGCHRLWTFEEFYVRLDGRPQRLFPKDLLLLGIFLNTDTT